MLKRWKSLPLFRTLEVCVRRTRRKDIDTVGITDRLSEVAGELSIVKAAVRDMRVGEPEDFGFYLILRRQIDKIQEIRTEVHPPQVK